MVTPSLLPNQRNRRPIVIMSYSPSWLPGLRKHRERMSISPRKWFCDDQNWTGCPLSSFRKEYVRTSLSRSVVVGVVHQVPRSRRSTPFAAVRFSGWSLKCCAILSEAADPPNPDPMTTTE
jgi:hypothetical protein